MRRTDPTIQDAWIFEKYKMTGRDYAALLTQQGGVCRLCSQPPGEEPLHVDHDHGCCGPKVKRTCGRCVRGLLCRGCNTMLGWYERRYMDWRDVEGYLRQGPSEYPTEVEAGRSDA
jgi:hypothetical protein